MTFSLCLWALNFSFWNVNQHFSKLLQTSWLIREKRMEPSVAKNLIKYDLNLKAVKFGNDKMWTFPWSKRENVQHFYFPRPECGYHSFWREKCLTFVLSHGLSVRNTSYFFSPPKPSSKLPIDLPIAAPILSSLYKRCRNSGRSVFHRLWYEKHIILWR